MDRLVADSVPAPTTQPDIIDDARDGKIAAMLTASASKPVSDAIDWEAWAAHHPGFMPVPANKPTVLASLALLWQVEGTL